MKMTFKIIQNILLLILVGCGNNSDGNLKITSNITKTIKSNEVVKISVSEPFDSINIFSSSKLIYRTVDSTLNNINIDLTAFKLGENNIEFVSFFKKSNKSKKYNFIVLNDKRPEEFSYKIINTYPHDINSFTQGLEFNNGFLYESTGRYGKSKLRKIKYKTGEIIQEVEVSNKYFAEGLTILNNKLIQLTWKEDIGLIYSLNNLNLIDQFYYNKSLEGWGLCNDKNKIYKSDGTEKIWVLDSDTYKELDNIQVYTDTGKVNNLNELEWVNGKIYANIYGSDGVAIINPNNGAVEGVINLSGLKKMVTNHNSLDVLNGLAFNQESKTLFVTGKMWDKIFEIKIIKK
jgi:glutamine cyclotransferase